MTSWEERWPPERSMMYIKDRLSESAIQIIFEGMILDGGGWA